MLLLFSSLWSPT